MKIKGKKLWSIIGLSVAAVSLLAAGYFGVVAYNTDREIMENKVSVGQNTITVDEPPYTPPPVLTDGWNEYNKTPRISNTGDIDVYVRMCMEISDEEIRYRSGFNTGVGGDVYYSAMTSGESPYAEDLWDDGNGMINPESFLQHLPEGWVYVPRTDDTAVTYSDDAYNVATTKGNLLGGYFYYTKPLKSGEETTALYKKVVTHFETEDDARPYNIIVFAESVQTKSHLGEAFDDWQDAWVENLARK